jgi:hypothetical protein
MTPIRPEPIRQSKDGHMKKLFSLAAAVLLVGSLASVSAFAADAPKAAPKKAAAAHHVKSCDDFAYQSQAAKDCMAKGDMKMKKSTKATKTSATKKAPAAATKKAM